MDQSGPEDFSLLVSENEESEIGQSEGGDLGNQEFLLVTDDGESEIDESENEELENVNLENEESEQHELSLLGEFTARFSNLFYKTIGICLGYHFREILDLRRHFEHFFEISYLEKF